ncbi:ABC transporter permease [Paenibacillus protaetiae]|uniref:Permease n=1 Tax=Paenibacillus protaetiae TaxID=2509456 RepID=A0A4V0YFC7_9BACL|nr:ABC transporter permease [Paenibacillus protaetiae]QAY67251.1 permease [Paenibacillus protaetiae]
MIGKALSSDLLKIRGKGLWLLAAGAPLGLVALMALNFGLRYDYFVNDYGHNLWGVLLEYTSYFVPVSLFLGCTLVSSLLANVEHGTSSWKQLLALPISRLAVFSSKFAVSVLLLTSSCALLAAGTAVLGFALGSGGEMPVGGLLRLSFCPFLASWPMLALMLWLCLSFKNQALPITFGVVASVGSLFTMSLSEWLPLNWPAAAYRGDHAVLFVGAGIVFGMIILALGLLHFNRKDVE